MTSGFQFWDGEIWSFIVTVALLFGAMLLANLLRRQIRFLRRSLIPSAVLGGFIILLLDSLYKRFFGHSMFSLSTLEALTYHGLGLGFVALAWRHLDGVKGKKARRDVFNTSTVTVGGYLVQAIVGLLITLVLSYLLGSFAAGGLLLPMGYGQGPGQAFNWGNNPVSVSLLPQWVLFLPASAVCIILIKCVSPVIIVPSLKMPKKWKIFLLNILRETGKSLSLNPWTSSPCSSAMSS